MKDMTAGSPRAIILQFAIPILLGNLLQLTYHIADTRIVGSFLGDAALAAVGATSVLCSLYIGFFNGMTNGFAIITAYYFGRKEHDRVRQSFASSLLLGFTSAMLLCTLTLGLLKPLLHFLNVPEELLPESAGYIRIIIAGLMITMLYNVLLASARAIGDSITPLLTLILSVVLNILGDILLIGVFHTGVRGAAIATVSAQTITLMICAVYLLKKYDLFRLKKQDVQNLSFHMIKNMFLSGLSMGLMSSMISLGSLILQTAINGLGSSYIVAQSAARRITEVMMSIFVAIGQTLTTYCSQNNGAGRRDRILLGMKAGYLFTCSWCIVVLLIIYPAAPFLVRLITGSSDLVMIEAAALYLRVDSTLYVLVAVIFVLRHSLQGIGDRVTPLISSGIEMVGKFILTATLVPAAGYHGVILVEPIVWIVMIIPLITRMRKWKREK